MNARFDVVLFSERGLDRSYAEETAAWFHRVPGPISIRVEKRSVELPVDESGLLSLDAAFSRLQKLRSDSQISDAAVVFLLTKTPNEGNLFSAADGEARSGFGHVDDFRWVTTAPVSVMLTRYIFEAVYGAALV